MWRGATGDKSGHRHRGEKTVYGDMVVSYVQHATSGIVTSDRVFKGIFTFDLPIVNSKLDLVINKGQRYDGSPLSRISRKVLVA